MKSLTLPLSFILLATSCSQVEIHNVTVTRYLGDRQAAVSLTFDDGMLCHYTDVAPALEANGLRGTFWIIGANMDREEPEYPWMTWEQVADLSHRGHEISNHTWNHPNLTQLSPDDLRWEVEYCDSVITSFTGLKPRTFCYPYNAMSPEVVAFCNQGRVGTRTYQEAQGQAESHQTAESMQAWLDHIIQTGEWGVTMTHGTTYGWDKWDEPQLLYDFFVQLNAASDSVWTAPFAEVASYITERDNIEFSWTMGNRCLVITPLLHDLDTSLYTQPLTLRIDGTFSGINPRAEQNGHSLTIINRDSVLLLDINLTDEVILKW